MTQFQTLQYNTDNLRLGIDYFKNQIANKDICFLQRCNNDAIELLKKQFAQVWTQPHSCNLSCVIATQNTSVSLIEKLKLPSWNTTTTFDDDFQGSSAVVVKINNTVMISALPGYDENNMHNDQLCYGDIEYLLERYQDNRTLIVGDFHRPPWDTRTLELLNNYKFNSYIDSAITFYHQSGNRFNLDKCIANFDLSIKDVHSHQTAREKQGHYAVTYVLTDLTL